MYLHEEFAAVLRHSVAGASAVQPLITGKVGIDGGAQTFKDFGSPERYAKIFVELGIAKKPLLPRRGGHGLVSTPVSVYIPERTRMAQLASEQRCCS
jgi:hypothetical protein